MTIRRREKRKCRHKMNGITQALNSTIYKMNNLNELGYKAQYVLIGLGQLPFDIFTKIS